MKPHDILSPASLNSNLRSLVKSSDIILGCYNRYDVARELAGMSGSVIVYVTTNFVYRGTESSLTHKRRCYTTGICDWTL